jgi:hypothetical protein
VPGAEASLVGVWRLLVYEDRESDDDPWVATYGSSALGLIVYTQDGIVAVQIAADPALESAPAFVAYLGRFVVASARRDGDRYRGVVEHHMTAASDPDLLREAPERPFEVDASRLVLGDGATWRRILERAK